MRTYIGIDNGTTGTIAIIGDDVVFVNTPVKVEQDYTKRKKNITRVDTKALYSLLSELKNPFALIERPMVNPTRFAATETALRCHEAELCIIELLGIPYQFVDSKEWQKEFLPKGADTKKASLDIGNRLFPSFKNDRHGDRDALLIAEYARRKNF